jgi:hypothetical protein
MNKEPLLWAVFGMKVNLKPHCMLGIPLTLMTVVLGTVWLMALL